MNLHLLTKKLSTEQYLEIIDLVDKFGVQYIDFIGDGEPNNLRVEFSPMEMGENWIETVKYLYKIIKDFENVFIA